MNTKTTFPSLLAHFRKAAHSERDKGDRFERLMQAWLRTDPQFEHQFSHIWLWSDFPAQHDFGSVNPAGTWSSQPTN